MEEEVNYIKCSFYGSFLFVMTLSENLLKWKLLILNLLNLLVLHIGFMERKLYEKWQGGDVYVTDSHMKESSLENKVDSF